MPIEKTKPFHKGYWENLTTVSRMYKYINNDVITDKLKQDRRGSDMHFYQTKEYTDPQEEKWVYKKYHEITRVYANKYLEIVMVFQRYVPKGKLPIVYFYVLDKSDLRNCLYESHSYNKYNKTNEYAGLKALESFIRGYMEHYKETNKINLQLKDKTL